jgi:hypothetical protein
MWQKAGDINMKAYVTIEETSCLIRSLCYISVYTFTRICVCRTSFSIVTRLLTGRTKNRGSILDDSRKFSRSHLIQTGSESTVQASCTVRYQGILPRE